MLSLRFLALLFSVWFHSWAQFLGKKKKEEEDTYGYQQLQPDGLH